MHRTNSRAAFVTAFLACLAHSSTVQAAAALAIAEGEHGTSYYWVGSQNSVSIARQLAMKDCTEAQAVTKKTVECRVVLTRSGPAFWAIYHAENGLFGVAADEDKEWAIDAAYDQCSKRGTCPDRVERIWFDKGE